MYLQVIHTYKHHVTCTRMHGLGACGIANQRHHNEGVRYMNIYPDVNSFSLITKIKVL